MRLAHDLPGDTRKRWRWVDLHPGASFLTEYGGSPVLIGAEPIPLPCRLVGGLDEVVAIQRRRVHAGDLQGAASTNLADELPCWEEPKWSAPTAPETSQVLAQAGALDFPNQRPRPA
jgi:hypothetical protein